MPDSTKLFLVLSTDLDSTYFIKRSLDEAFPGARSHVVGSIDDVSLSDLATVDGIVIHRTLGLDPLEAASALRARYPQAPMILATARVNSQAALGAGATRHISMDHWEEIGKKLADLVTNPAP